MDTLQHQPTVDEGRINRILDGEPEPDPVEMAKQLLWQRRPQAERDSIAELVQRARDTAASLGSLGTFAYFERASNVPGIESKDNDVEQLLAVVDGALAEADRSLADARRFLQEHGREV